ncbi:carbohydrate ABC transporter permease [Eubacteriales bacterium mix99]
MKSKKRSGHAGRVGMFIGLLVAAVFFLFPIYWAITMSFKKKGDILVTIPQFFPIRPTLENYVEIMQRSSFPTFAGNSIMVSLVTTLICVIIAAMAGYGLTRFSVSGRSQISTGIYIIRMVPGLVYTVPLYMIYQQIHLIDNRWGLILAYCTFSLPMSIWLFLSFYEEIPKEIYESASIDGCSDYRMFISIALPLVLSGVSVVAILCFIGAWNEFSLALTLTFRDAYKTLPIGINSMIQRERDTPFGSMAAVGTMAMLPAIILSLTMQKYIVKGFTAGAVKG